MAGRIGERYLHDSKDSRSLLARDFLFKVQVNENGIYSIRLSKEASLRPLFGGAQGGGKV